MVNFDLHYRTMKKQINLNQRYQIASLLKAGISKSDIAKNIGFSPQTIYNEINRNSVRTPKGEDVYKPGMAQHYCDLRHKHKNKCKKLSYSVKRIIHWLIKRGWSPEQIAATCKQRKITMVCYESIYLYLYKLKSKGTDLCIYLRRHHRKRRKRKDSNHSRQIIKNKVHISKRPKSADTASRTGHMEIDLVKCTNGYLLTLTDRKSLFNIIRKLPNKSSSSVISSIQTLISLYLYKIKTITSDNGTEFSQHQIAALLLKANWYFADAYCSQQRGCNENQNGLIRQYFKRDTDLAQVSDAEIIKIQNKLNCRPRKKLNYKKPLEVFYNTKRWYKYLESEN